jgi:hypothetical protein
MPFQITKLSANNIKITGGPKPLYFTPYNIVLTIDGDTVIIHDQERNSIGIHVDDMDTEYLNPDGSSAGNMTFTTGEELADQILSLFFLGDGSSLSPGPADPAGSPFYVIESHFIEHLSRAGDISANNTSTVAVPSMFSSIIGTGTIMSRIFSESYWNIINNPDLQYCNQKYTALPVPLRQPSKENIPIGVIRLQHSFPANIAVSSTTSRIGILDRSANSSATYVNNADSLISINSAPTIYIEAILAFDFDTQPAANKLSASAYFGFQLSSAGHDVDVFKLGFFIRNDGSIGTLPANPAISSGDEYYIHAIFNDPGSLVQGALNQTFATPLLESSFNSTNSIAGGGPEKFVRLGLRIDNYYDSLNDRAKTRLRYYINKFANPRVDKILTSSTTGEKMGVFANSIYGDLELVCKIFTTGGTPTVNQDDSIWVDYMYIGTEVDNDKKYMQQ